MKSNKIYENGLDNQPGQHKQAKEILTRNGHTGKFSNFSPLIKGTVVENPYSKFVRMFEIDGYEFHVWNREKIHMGMDFKLSSPVWSEEVYYQPTNTTPVLTTNQIN